MKQANYESYFLFEYHSKHLATYPITTPEYPSFWLSYTVSDIQQSNPYNTYHQTSY